MNVTTVQRGKFLMANASTILCVGAMLWDVIGRSPMTLSVGQDVPGSILQRPGGVALNVAMALAWRGLNPIILSVVGRDASGDVLIGEAERFGVDCSALYRTKGPGTDIYMAIEDCDKLVASIADARSLELAGEQILAPLRDGRLASADQPWRGMIVLDSNPTADVIAQFLHDPALREADLNIAPASPSKAARLSPLLTRGKTSFYLNRDEAEVLAGRASISAADAAEAVVARGARRVIVTDGARPVAEAMRDAPTITLAPPPVHQIARLTGAGDFFLAAHLHAQITGATRHKALEEALVAASAYVSGKDIP